MAEESGKGIALVILGIVAIIAIVGLVLLFTGMKGKTAGEFAIPSAKEYGGAIQGVYDPYARAFSGRAFEYDSGQQGIFRGQGEMDTDHKVAWQVDPRGEATYTRTVSGQSNLAYNRQMEKIPSSTKCAGISYLTLGDPNAYPDGASVQECDAPGANCMVLSEMRGLDQQVLANQYGLDRDRVIALKDALGSAMVDGVWACKPQTRLSGTV